MPGKSANVKNEKQYENAEGERHVEVARGEDRQLARRLEPGWQKVAFGLVAQQLVAGRHDRPEEAAGRKGGRATARKS